MALNMGQTRRHRSSTAASRGLNADERSSHVAELVQRLAVREKDATSESTVAILDELKRELSRDNTSRDLFRHAKGFEHLLKLLQESHASVERDPGGQGKVVNAVWAHLMMSQACGQRTKNHCS